MPEFEHTKGPWGVVVEFDREAPDYNGEGRAYIVTEDTDDDGLHTTIGQIGSFGEFHEAVANANLMAAAPEMLRGLLLTKSVIEGKKTLMDLDPACVDLAKMIGLIIDIAIPDPGKEFERWHPGGGGSCASNQNRGNLPPIVIDEDGEIKI